MGVDACITMLVMMISLKLKLSAYSECDLEISSQCDLHIDVHLH